MLKDKQKGFFSEDFKDLVEKMISLEATRIDM
jgi:hypothetical protein